MSIRDALGPARRGGKRGEPIQTTPDLKRILALPRREPEDLAVDLTDALRTQCGTMTLREAQARALVEAVERGGLLGAIRVGGGKTIPSILLPTMFDADRPLLLVPSSVVDRTYREIEIIRKHFDVVVPYVLGYEWLGRPQAADELRRYAPDIITADEVHRLRHRSSAVTRRVERYMRANPTTTFCGLSGTLQGERLQSYRHLAAWALGKGSPIPLDEDECKRWDQALNPEDNAHPLNPGVLEDRFGDDPNAGLGAWIRDTPGVVSTTAKGCNATIEIDRWNAPKVCEDLLDQVVAMQERPDGTPMSPAEVADMQCQLALGFWYRWDPQPPEEWLDARREWCRFVRDVLDDMDVEDPDSLDSEAQVAKFYPARHAAWLSVKGIYQPMVSPVWVSRDVVRAAERWAVDNQGIVWSRYRAFGDAMDELMPHYGRKGLEPSGRFIEQASGPISASIRSCGVGMNLQQYQNNLLVTPTPNAEILEQLLGRTHREGQKADLIRLSWIRSIGYHTDCLRRARNSADILERQNQEPQKLTAATYL